MFKNIPQKVDTTDTEYIEEDDDITSLSCGLQHVCWSTKDRRAKCQGGDSAVGEATLHADMQSDVLAVQAGKNRSCVLKNGQELCIGNPQSKFNTS